MNLPSTAFDTGPDFCAGLLLIITPTNIYPYFTINELIFSPSL